MLDWFGMHGSRPDRISELGSCAAITGCAAAGMGVAAVPESWLAALGGAIGAIGAIGARVPDEPGRNEKSAAGCDDPAALQVRNDWVSLIPPGLPKASGGSSDQINQ